MSDAYEKCDGKELVAAPIEDGYGDIHVNRFRIYFYISSLSELDQITQKLFNNFDTYLQLSFTDPVHVNKYKGEKGSDFLQFVVNDPKGLVMDDWVKVGWHPANRGFAVETQRYFTMNIFWGPEFRNHFLCGRRSWIVGRLEPANTVLHSQQVASGLLDVLFHGQTEQTHNYAVKYRCFVETAAVERFSSWPMSIGDLLDPTKPIPFWLQIRGVWIAMLNNFAKRNHLETFSLDDPFVHGPESDTERSVSVQRKVYANPRELLNDAYGQEVLSSHPYLKSQKYTAF